MIHTQGRAKRVETPDKAHEAYLVIRLVFPTLWSPRSTILLRFSGGEEKSAVTGVVADMSGAKQERGDADQRWGDAELY